MAIPTRITGGRFRLHSFTLVELLVAMAILSLLILILAKILDTTRQAWLSAESGNDSFREGRAALYVISHDLQNAHLTSATPMQINTNYTGAPVSAANIFFLASTTQAAQLIASNSPITGDICSVGYYIAYTPDLSTDVATAHSSYKLYRYFHNSTQTYNDITAGQLFSGAEPTNVGAGQDEVLAHNICNLNIQYITTTVGDIFKATPVTFPDPTGAKALAEVSISLDALNDHFAIQFPKATWEDPTKNAYKQAAHTFSNRIPIPPAQ